MFSFCSYFQRWFAYLSPFLEPQNLKDTTEEFQRNLSVAPEEFQRNLSVPPEEFQRNLSVAQDYKPKLQDMVIIHIFIIQLGIASSIHTTPPQLSPFSSDSHYSANILFYKLNKFREFKS